MRYEHFTEFENSPPIEPAGLAWKIMSEILPPAEEDITHEAKGLNEAFRADFTDCNRSFLGFRHRISGIVIWKGRDIHGMDSFQLSDVPDGTCFIHCCTKDIAVYNGVMPGDRVTVEGNYIDCHPKYGVVFKMCEVVSKE